MTQKPLLFLYPNGVTREGIFSMYIRKESYVQLSS